MSAPLILTLALEQEAQERFDAERREHFPPGRTVVGAHLTLFHALPGEDVDAVLASVRSAAVRDAFDVEVTGLMSLGRGVAYRVRSADLDAVHGALRRRWLERLTPQDRQPFRPHVTVQNKAVPAVARETLALLEARFRPFGVRALGLDLWRYDDGPWTLLHRAEFGVPLPAEG